MSHINKFRQISPDHTTNYILSDSGTWTKLSPTAIDPIRESLSDIGYTLSVVERCDGKVEDEIGRANWFTTHLSVIAPKYHHFELIPHPELDRSGYSFLNSPKIIYDGEEIKIPLVKNGAEGTEDLSLPFTVGLLVLRETCHTELKLIQSVINNHTSNRNINQNPYAQPQVINYEPVPQPTTNSSRGRGRGRGRGKAVDM